MQIEKIINEKYPLPAGETMYYQYRLRQAAHFGYSLGEAERKEQSEVIQVLKDHIMQVWEVIIPRLTDKELQELKNRLPL